VVGAEDVDARCSIPLPAVVRDELKARYAALNGNVVRFGPDERTVFTAAEGGPRHYPGFHTRVWVPLVKRAGLKGTPHLLRHAYVTALIQPGDNSKSADAHGPPLGRLHHGPVRGRLARGAFECGREGRGLLLPSSGSKTRAGRG
jgi:hypothetical protein